MTLSKYLNTGSVKFSLIRMFWTTGSRVRFFIEYKVVKLLAMDEGVGGMELTSDLISGPMQYGSFHPTLIGSGRPHQAISHREVYAKEHCPTHIWGILQNEGNIFTLRLIARGSETRHLAMTHTSNTPSVQCTFIYSSFENVKERENRMNEACYDIKILNRRFEFKKKKKRDSFFWIVHIRSFLSIKLLSLEIGSF